MTNFSERRLAAQRFNPFSVKEGQQIYPLLVDCQATLHDGRELNWCGHISLPPAVGGLKTTATSAFVYLQEQGSTCRLMSLCTFYFCS